MSGFIPTEGLSLLQTNPIVMDGRALASVDIWRVALRIFPDDDTCLDAHEFNRANRFATGALRRRYVASRVALRHLVASNMGLEPAEIEFARQPCPTCGGPHGRPIVPHRQIPLHFSLSRTGDTAVIALSNETVGIDVEQIPERIDSYLAASAFAPCESEHFFSLSRQARPRYFMRIWTAKEAVLKCTGEGIGGCPPHTLCVGHQSESPREVIVERRGVFHKVVEVNAGPRLVATLAMPGQMRQDPRTPWCAKCRRPVVVAPNEGQVSDLETRRNAGATRPCPSCL